jgi:uncharacterized protein (DUF2252 family)
MMPTFSLPTLADRRAAGKRLRDKAPRVDQSKWKPARGRDIVATITESNAGRLPHLVPIKIGRMAVSPFAFFRGAAPLMAHDIAKQRVTGLRVQLCGDAHVRNLGAYAAPDGHLVFDLNDFDETITAPWEWDLKRLAVSVVLAGREAGDGDKDCRDAVEELARCYREALNFYSRMKPMDLAKYEIRREAETEVVRNILDKAERVTPAKTLKKLTIPAKDGVPKFHDQLPLLQHVPDQTRDAVINSLPGYRDTVSAGRQVILDAYKPVDVAFKVVGTGSVGTRDYVVLLFGNGLDDPMFLQLKEEMPSCYTPYLTPPQRYPHEGQRVAQGQQRMQTVVDPFLGWATIERRPYLVRQLSDHKAAIDPRDLKSPALREYAIVCGMVLAKGHARTGDAAAMFGYCGDSAKLDKAISKFAVLYADQVTLDYETFLAAITAGTIKAQHQSP